MVIRRKNVAMKRFAEQHIIKLQSLNAVKCFHEQNNIIMNNELTTVMG